MVATAGNWTYQAQAATLETEAFAYAELPQRQYPSLAKDSEPIQFPQTEWPEWRERSSMSSNSDRGRKIGTQSYAYSIEPGFPSEDEIENPSSDGGSALDAAPDPALENNEKFFQQLLATETSKAEERGRAAGMEQGISLGREEAARQLQSEREQLMAKATTSLEDFSSERESYFHRIEQETVKLALAIAARILRHGAQTDPLLLTGAVRVALGQLASSTSVRLHVPLQDQTMWEEAMARMPGLPLRPQVIGDAGMELGDCRMETDLGFANLGLWPQLKAIEQGFFERSEEQGNQQVALQATEVSDDE